MSHNIFEEPNENLLQASGITELSILGIELTQSIQSMNHDVSIVEGKPALVRVYIDQRTIMTSINVTGEIRWYSDAGEHFVVPINIVNIDSTTPKDLESQRDELSAALNFILPPEALQEGLLVIALDRLRIVGEGEVAINGNTQLRLTVEKAPPLRIRVIGFRYTDGNQSFTPDAVHFAFFKSYLLRSFPTNNIDWSQIVVDGNFQAPFDDITASRVHAHLAAMRSREISAGVDPRTHYYGIVSDANGRYFLRGKAADIPGIPSPDIVACGPVGEPNGGFGGDTDVSYADWYGAHELCHTYGRYHPGFPPYDPVTERGQDASDANFPYPEGNLSSDALEHVGFDIGDNNLNLPMKILPRQLHHDVMTYKEKQWLSAYTYQAILERLRQEDELFN
ncbi:MAG: hypothetical protein GQ582_13800 [Methyloprofundus sp.]|nr:hypothetical protein [Methyloprofundus sp.]